MRMQFYCCCSFINCGIKNKKKKSAEAAQSVQSWAETAGSA